jgi:NitT/TauT family transport system ATP-binding protein
VRVGTISGLLELIVEGGESSVEIARLAERLALPMDDLLAILDAATLLEFATTAEGDVTITDLGSDYATTTILRSKDLFRQQVLAHAPIIATIATTLNEKANKSMRADFFLDILDEHYPAEEARRQFETAVEWARYAELFEYDAGEELLYIA